MIKRAIITEQSMGRAKNNFYTFEVSKDSTKELIAKLVAQKFGVDVLAVKTITIPAKKRTQKTRKGFYYKVGMKKAIVQIKKGQKIAMFETIATEAEAEVTTVENVETKSTQVKEKKSLLKGTKVKIEREAK